jgi:hypothetical protein
VSNAVIVAFVISARIAEKQPLNGQLDAAIQPMTLNLSEITSFG